MGLTKLRDSFPKLSAIEIINKIANGSISGMWIRISDLEKAKQLANNNLTEKEAIEFLDKVDENRNADYYFDKLFD